MPRYFIRWEIDIFNADSPEDAAIQALDIQRDRFGQATFFSVAEVDEDGQQDGHYPPREFVNVDVEQYLEAPSLR